MEFNPRVSIVIPVYNGSNYLQEAIDSALAQTYKNIEVIVVNDGSNDGGKTEEVARSYGDNVRYFYKKNGGVASALNLGIREMTGEYFSWLSHDDIYYPNKIKVQIDYLKDNEGRDVILYSNYEVIDHRSHFIKKKVIKKIAPDKFRLSLIVSDPVNGCTTLIPRHCLNKVGFFNERLRTAQDYDMWFRLAGSYEFVHIPKILLRYRIHSQQGSNSISTFLSESTNIINGFLQKLGEDELKSFTGVQPGIFYLKVAIRLKLRGLFDSAEFAFNLSKKYKGERFSIENRLLTFFYRILNRKLKPSNWF